MSWSRAPSQEWRISLPLNSFAKQFLHIILIFCATVFFSERWMTNEGGADTTEKKRKRRTRMINDSSRL